MKATSRSTLTAVNVDSDAQLLNLAKRLKPRIPPTFPYGHPLGPSGNAPKTFGHCGGGNHSLPAAPSHDAEKSEVAALQEIWPGGGYSIEYVHKRAPLWAREFKNNNRRWNRILANGGRKRPVGRPRRDLSPEEERSAREMLRSGSGVNRVAKALGLGNNTVIRLKRALS